MRNDERSLVRKELPKQLVAAMRFMGEQGEIVERLARLKNLVGERASGKPIILRHGGHPDYGWDIELCLPIGKEFEAEEIQCRVLAGGEMLTLRHEGPRENLQSAWAALWAEIGARNIGITEGPIREAFIEDEQEHGDDSASFVTEIQASSLLPVWLERFATGLDEAVGEEKRREIMIGCEGMSEESSPAEKSAWAGAAMKRLDAAVDDQAQRTSVMSGCAHRFPQWRIDAMREVYEKTDSVDEVLYHLGKDQRWGSPHFYSPPWREGLAIYVSKITSDPRAWLEADDDAGRRAAYCHCPMIKHTLASGDEISDTYCHCGGGFYRQLWEGVIGRPVEVEIVESVLMGDDRCTFAIHLPEDA